MTYRQLLLLFTDFRRLWCGQVVSEVGDWLNNIAVFALVIELAGSTHQGRAIAFYSLARHIPLFLFGPIAGVVVDRFDRRRVMIRADIARAVLTCGFFVADFYHSLPLIYLTGASLFTLSAFFNAAKRAAIPNIVPSPDALLTANALSASTTAATIAVGSALGGIIATLAGRGTVFSINIITFVISAFFIRTIKSRTNVNDHANEIPAITSEAVASDEDAFTSRGKIIGVASTVADQNFAASRSRLIFTALRRSVGDFQSGAAYVRRDRTLRLVFIVAAGWGLGNGIARALYSIFGATLGASDARWSERPEDFGISVLFVAMGLGGVIGAPVARRFNQRAGADVRSLGTRMGRALTLDGLSLALFSFMPTLWSAAAMLVVREINFATWWTAQQTMLMRRTDTRFGGRVFASFETLTTLAMVSSMFAAGFAADRYGIRPVACVGGIIVASSGLLWFALHGKENRRIT